VSGEIRFEKKKRKTPGNAPKTSPRISQTQMHALSLSQAGRSHEAIEFLRAKCDGANPDPLLLSLLGLLESRAGLPQVALERTREAAEKSPKNLETLLNYGEVLVA
jgi:Flp pilus assembly protein TadD